LRLREADIEELTIYSLFLPSECSRGSYYLSPLWGDCIQGTCSSGYCNILTDIHYFLLLYTWLESMLQH